jgi:flavodoxin
MKVLVTYFSQTGNTQRVAEAIEEEVSARGFACSRKDLTELTPSDLNDYDLVFMGSACHSTSLAEPALKLLKGLESSAKFMLAGFVTHSVSPPDGSAAARTLYEKWAGNCRLSFEKACENSRVRFLGYFGCQGAPSPPIEEFIHATIITDPDEWEKYLTSVRSHPDETDIASAKEFTVNILDSIST